MKDNRLARSLYLVDRLESHAPHPHGRRVLVEWIGEQLDALPSDPWDPEPGDTSMETVIERYPAYLQDLERIQENRRLATQQVSIYVSYVDVQDRMRHFMNDLEALQDARVTLIRHGESAANAGKATDDPATIPLTSKGEEQARLAAGRIDSPDLIVSSPFARALATAQPLRDRYPETPFAEWPIQEFTYLSPARCAGTTVADRKAWVREYWSRADLHHLDGPGAESFAQFVARVVEFLHRLREQPDGHRVAVFGHGQFFNATRWIMETGGVPESAADVLARTPTPMSDLMMFELKNHISNGEMCGLLI